MNMVISYKHVLVMNQLTGFWMDFGKSRFGQFVLAMILFILFQFACKCKGSPWPKLVRLGHVRDAKGKVVCCDSLPDSSSKV